MRSPHNIACWVGIVPKQNVLNQKHIVLTTDFTEKNLQIQKIPNGFNPYMFDENLTKDVTTTGVIVGEKYMFFKTAFI